MNFEYNANQSGYIETFKNRMADHNKSFIWFHKMYLKMSYQDFLMLLNFDESVNSELKSSINAFLIGYPKIEKRSYKKKKDAKT